MEKCPLGPCVIENLYSSHQPSLSSSARGLESRGVWGRRAGRHTASQHREPRPGRAWPPAAQAVRREKGRFQAPAPSQALACPPSSLVTFRLKSAKWGCALQPPAPGATWTPSEGRPPDENGRGSRRSRFRPRDAFSAFAPRQSPPAFPFLESLTPRQLSVPLSSFEARSLSHRADPSPPRG